MSRTAQAPSGSRGTSLESQLQRHLNLPRAADRMRHVPQSAGAVVEAFVGLGAARGAPSGGSRCAHGRELVVVLILENLVPGNVEAGRVGQVVHIKGVLEVDALFDIGHLDQRNVRALLPSLPEDIPLTIREVRFKGVSGRNG